MVAVPAENVAARERFWATAALMLATALQAADATIVNVALPTLTYDLGGSLELGAWVMTSYLCAAAIVAPLTGWLRRRFGAGRLYTAAASVFIGASLLCALAPTPGLIILFRTLQGAGGGVIPALCQAVLHDLHPPQRHGRVLAMWGAAAMIGPILGPAIGGIVTDLASWRWVFLLNLPLGALAIWGVRRAMREDGGTDGTALDALGLILLVAGVGCLQLVLQRGTGQAWLSSPELSIELVVAVVALGGLVLRTRRRGPMLLRFVVFRDRNFATAAFFNFTTSALLFTSIVFVPGLVQGPLGYPATVGGLAIVPRGVLMMLVILLVGRVIAWIDFRFAVAVGSLILAGGLLILADPSRAGDLWWIIAGSTVLAMGAGTILMPLSTFTFATLPIELRTDGAGLYSLLRQLGCAAGVAVMTAVLQLNMSGSLGQHALVHPLTLDPATFAAATAKGLTAYSDCFRIMAVVALGVMPGILFFSPKPRR